MPSTASQIFFDALPAAVNASGRWRRASTRPNADKPMRAAQKTNPMSDWRLPKMSMLTAYGAKAHAGIDNHDPGWAQTLAASSDSYDVDRPDPLTVAEHRGVGHLVKNLGINTYT